ncbi:unnamed protein product [Dovyalis caffra]|uniref:Defective in cullin neddylation protein n=1 Tax=Dovyalis caffra TaxID=77055 RepID=A0AAV1RLL8_9ROSI|nr:unnamed protein product [Dovyalis caffra]
MERIDNLFYSYANRSSGMIDPEGIETLCSDMEVDHTDVRILMLAWKMRAEKQGYFTLDEWRRGLKALRADTVNKLKKTLPELEKEEKQKSIDIESISQLLDLVLGSHFRGQVDYFIEYLKYMLLSGLLAYELDCRIDGQTDPAAAMFSADEMLCLFYIRAYSCFLGVVTISDKLAFTVVQIQSDYKVINMDQWMGFYRFCNEISFPDFSNYDPELAWPLILDNFVEWMRAKWT